MKRVMSVLLAALLWSQACLAEVEMLPHFNNRWDGSWTHLYEDGQSFYRLETAETLGPSFIDYTPKNPISMEQKYIYFRLRINAFKAWGGLEIRLSSDDKYENYYAINIPFYSDEEFNIIQAQQWIDYTSTLGGAQKVGNPDKKTIKHIGFFVQGQQIVKSGTFTVDFAEISLRKSLHKGILSITFDDGYDEQFEAAQIMANYGLRGTAYVMTNELNTKNYLTYEQVQKMGNEWHWGISSHHFTPITEMTEKEFNKEIDSTLSVLKELGFESDSLHFAYPLGKQNHKTTLPWIQEKFLTARVAGGGGETLPPANWLMLKTFNVTHEVSPEDLIARVKQAQENNEWLILMFHRFTEEPTSSDALVYPMADFEEFCKKLSAVGIPTHPVHEVYEAFHE